jgi:hypothetical protein
MRGGFFLVVSAFGGVLFSGDELRDTASDVRW